MKKIQQVVRRSVMIVSKYKITKYILISGLLFLVGGSGAMYQKYTNEKAKNAESSRIEEEVLANRGIIETDAVGEPSEDVEMSSYVLGDDYTDVEENEETKSSSSNPSPSISSYENKSYLSGRDITIAEDDDFDPMTSLNIKAADIDGTDITSKVIIDSNTVNSSEPGKYSVRALINLSNGSIIQKNFYVNVEERELNVDVNSFEAVEYGVEKNGTITFDLSLDVSKKKVTAKTVLINGKEYPIYKGKKGLLSLLSKKQNYKVIVKADDILGKKEYKLGYILMSDNTLVSTDNITTVDILKTEPVVKNFSYVEQTAKERIVTDFTFEDVDSAASNLKIALYKNDKNIYTQDIDKNEYKKIYLPTSGNGKYEIRIIGDVQLSTGPDENYTEIGKTIYSQSFKIKNNDKTSLKGENIEVNLGHTFNAVKDLNLKAVDFDGEDITDKITFDNINVDTNTEGIYTVKAQITNKYEEIISREFTVTVKKPVNKSKSENSSDNDEKEKTEEISTASINDGEEISAYSENEGRFISSRNSARITEKTNSEENTSIRSRMARISNSNTHTLSGNESDTLSAVVTVDGSIDNADGEAPEGKIQVEIPTSLSFAVDQNSAFKSGVYEIKNSSSCDIEVSISEFRHASLSRGIAIHPKNTEINNLDRSNIHLYIQGDRIVDLGAQITQPEKLIDIPAAKTKSIQLLGEAGRGKDQEVDKNGVSDKFTLLFKINKKED